MKNNRTKNRTIPYNNHSVRTKELKIKQNHYQILMLLSELTPVTKIAVILKKSKSTISEHISKLIKEGYLTNEKELTFKGREAVRFFSGGHVSTNAGLLRVRSHDLVFKLPISSDSSVFRDKVVNKGSWVEVCLNNWVKYVRHFEDGVKVHVTPKSVLFYLPELLGVEVEAVYNRALSLVFHYKRFLESKYDIVLGSPEVIAEVQSNHLAFKWDVFANLCRDNGVTFNGDRLTVDHSKGVPELEAVSPVFARDDLRSIFDFYEDLVKGSTSWFEVNQELKGRGVIVKALDEFGRRLDFLKRRQDTILNALGLDRVHFEGGDR